MLLLLYGQIHLLLPGLLNVLLKNFFVFHSNSMILGEVLVHIDNYNFTNFYWIQMKNKKGILMTHLTDGPSVKGKWIRPYYHSINWSNALFLLLGTRYRHVTTHNSWIFKQILKCFASTRWMYIPSPRQFEGNNVMKQITQNATITKYFLYWNFDKKNLIHLQKSFFLVK